MTHMVLPPCGTARPTPTWGARALSGPAGGRGVPVLRRRARRPGPDVLICAGAGGPPSPGGSGRMRWWPRSARFVAAGGASSGSGLPSAHPAHESPSSSPTSWASTGKIGWGLSAPSSARSAGALHLPGPDRRPRRRRGGHRRHQSRHRVLDAADGQVRLAVHELGRGRSDLHPTAPDCCTRAIFWARGCQETSRLGGLDRVGGRLPRWAHHPRHQQLPGAVTTTVPTGPPDGPSGGRRGTSGSPLPHPVPYPHSHSRAPRHQQRLPVCARRAPARFRRSAGHTVKKEAP